MARMEDGRLQGQAASDAAPARRVGTESFQCTYPLSHAGLQAKQQLQSLWERKGLGAAR